MAAGRALDDTRLTMLERTWIGALALAAVMSASGFVARAHDETNIRP